MNKRLLVLVGGGLFVLMASTLSAFDFGGGGTSSGSMAVGSAVGSSVHNKVLYTDNTGLLQELTLADGQVPTASAGAIVAGTIDAAPSTATYIMQTANAGTSAEQALSSLASGCLSVTTGTGVIASSGAACGGVTLRDQLQNTTGTTYDWVPYDQCNGTTCTSSIYFNDEFCGNNPATGATSNGNLSWSAWDGVGTGSAAKGASTFPNVCFLSLTSGATAGNFTGISLNDVATNGYGGLGDLHGNLNWELHWIFKFSSATTPAYYLGVASNPQSALIPTDWIGLQFDTGNSDVTNMTFVCKKGATVVRTDTTIAADTTFHHLRVWSTTTDQINFELYNASGAIQKQSLAVCGSTSIPTSSMIPFAQAGTQAASARTLSVDRFSYKMRGVSR